jgi:uncharacterized protein YcbK (DUF882 family)
MLPLAPRRLRLRHAATDAQFDGIYHSGVAPDPAALQELSMVLADSRTGAVHLYDSHVLDILWEVTQRMRLSDQLVVLSGYRTHQSNAAVEGAADSQHLKAAAIDVQLSPTRLVGFSEVALALHHGGVGVYARRGFVHIDSGPVRHWGDAPGRGTQPTDDPLARMAEAWAATRIPGR